MSLNPPFRADHVGSFLRPKFLIDAREQKARGEIGAVQLREVEDRAITDIVAFQQDVGLQSITDGEFRRTYFHIDFLEQLGGVQCDPPVLVRRPDGSEELAPPTMRVTGWKPGSNAGSTCASRSCSPRPGSIGCDHGNACTLASRSHCRVEAAAMKRSTSSARTTPSSRCASLMPQASSSALASSL